MLPIAVVIPTLQEAPTIEACLAPLQQARARGVEVVVVDGGSDDGTVELADRLADQVLSAPEPGRARQQNIGWRACKAARVVFLHADTCLGEPQLAALGALPVGAWGRFDVRLGGERITFRLIEAMMNWRSRLTGMATGDQALFADRVLLEAVDGFPELPLMEDLALCRRLRGQGRYHCLRPPVVTSSRRWEQHGVWRTVLLMWRLRYAWWRGADPADLARRYGNAR